MAIVLAVGDEPEPEILLQAHHLADGGVLDALELGVGNLVPIGPLARLDQRVRPDQAADMVGAERRLGSFGHARLRGSRPLDIFPKR